MSLDPYIFVVFCLVLGAVAVWPASQLYFRAKEDYVDRLIKKRKGNSYGDW